VTIARRLSTNVLNFKGRQRISSQKAAQDLQHTLASGKAMQVVEHSMTQLPPDRRDVCDGHVLHRVDRQSAIVDRVSLCRGYEVLHPRFLPPSIGQFDLEIGVMNLHVASLAEAT
jgi:hypothetical protein